VGRGRGRHTSGVEVGRSGPDPAELQAPENVGRQSGSDGKGDAEGRSIPRTRSRTRPQRAKTGFMP
jgi:hypothetical protein